MSAGMLRIFHNLRVGQKLALISVIFVIPDTLLLCFFLFNINGNIRFAQAEKDGDRYQRPLQQLLQDISEHQIVQNRMREPSSQASPETQRRLSSLRERVASGIADLLAVDQQLGAGLQFTLEGLSKRNRDRCRASLIRARWEDLVRGLDQRADSELRQQHQQLISDIRGMITHAGDNSNLILDPDLDSYYLMDVTLLALPEMQERLAAVRLFAEGLLARGEPIGLEDQKRLAVFAEMLKQADLNRALSSMRTALNEDLNFYGKSASLQEKLPPALSSFESAQKQFITLVGRLSQAGSSSISPDQFRKAGEQASQSSFELWDTAVRELDGLLERRMQHFRWQRNRSLIVSAMAFACAWFLVTFITRSISGPLQRQAREMQEANLALQEQIVERRRVEDALRVAEEQYRGIFEHAVEGIFQTTPEGAYIVANPTLIQIYGYQSIEELRGGIRSIGSQLYVEPDRRGPSSGSRWNPPDPSPALNHRHTGRTGASSGSLRTPGR